MNEQILIGLGISIGIATPVTLAWSEFLHWLVRHPDDPKEKAVRIRWIPITTGVMERILFTVLIGWSVSGSAGFIGSWVLVKQLGGWNSWGKGTHHGVKLFFIGMLGNAMSVLFGVIGGLVIFRALNPS